MKKILILLSFACAAGFANASYLFWQVNTSAFDSGTSYKFNGNDVTGVRVSYALNGSENKTALTTYYYDGSDGWTEYTANNGTPSVNAAANGMYVDLGEATGNSYSYYVEIVGANNAVLGATESGLSYADANSYIVASLSDISSQLQATGWGASQTYVVPEPTGAMLMIFGLAMLGLKRRKV